MIHHGDLFDVLPTLDAESIEACVTDPPYGIGFMGKQWDTFKPDVAAKKQGLRQLDKSPRWREGDRRLINPNLKGRTVDGAISSSQIEYDRSLVGQRGFQDWCEKWAGEVIRVLKPGAYLAVCGAPRSYHRMASGLEDAGFEIRDCFCWLFGQGFPKSLNVGDGRGTALKPAYEPIVLARKPFKGSLTANLQKHGTGAINIDQCRIGTDDTRRIKAGGANDFPHEDDAWTPRTVTVGSEHGRWPANVLLDEEAAEILDEQSGELYGPGGPASTGSSSRSWLGDSGEQGRIYPGQTGGASRFFYVAKPSREEREHGIYDLDPRQRDESRKEGNPGGDNPRNIGLQRRGNHHPTVKPLELMRWLVRLVTPPGGIVLDPFCGSGTTGMACAFEFREFIGIEREAEYVEIATRRIAACAPLFTDTVANT